MKGENMDLENLSLRTHAMLRKAGLEKVPPHVLIGVLLLGFLLVLFAIWHFWPRANADFVSSQESVVQTIDAKDHDAQNATTEILVDVEGAVTNPGLHSLDSSARIGDAVEAAGGLSEDAITGSLNLAQKLNDGDQIIVPSINDPRTDISAMTPDNTGITAGATKDATGKLNINTASSKDLQELSGIGPALAQRIVEHREANGRFQSIEDLKMVSGIGDAKFASVKDKICV